MAEDRDSQGAVRTSVTLFVQQMPFPGSGDNVVTHPLVHSVTIFESLGFGAEIVVSR